MKSSTLYIGLMAGLMIVCAVVFVAGFPLMARWSAMMGGLGTGGRAPIMPGYGMMGDGAVLGFWRMAVMGLITLIVVLGLGAGLWALASRSGAPVATSAPGGPASPLDVLRLRYARGELTKEQFEQMKADIL